MNKHDVTALLCGCDANHSGYRHHEVIGDVPELAQPPTQEHVGVKYDCGSATHRGRARSVNQDRALVEPDIGLFGVFDGMGGVGGGEIAAQLAHNAMVDFIRKFIHNPEHSEVSERTLLQLAIEAAGDTVYSARHARPEYQDMGTTVVACIYTADNRLAVAHVGDSRAYLLRGDVLCQLTRDHSVVQTLIDAGQLTEEEAKVSPLRHHITRNLGVSDGVSVEVLDQLLETGDRLLLCTDGLHGSLSEEAIRVVLGADDSAQAIATSLAATALSAGGMDDVTAVVVAKLNK